VLGTAFVDGEPNPAADPGGSGFGLIVVYSYMFRDTMVLIPYKP
jgi:hypothetical protein